MRAGRRRIAFHSEDEYRLQERKSLFKSGDALQQPHGMARRGMCVPRHPAVDGAGSQDRPARRISCMSRPREELEYLQRLPRYRDRRGAGEPPDPGRAGLLRTAGRLRRDEPADPRPAPPGCELGGRATTARWIRSAPITRRIRGTAKALPWPDCPAGLTGVQTLVPIMLDHVNAGRLSLTRHGRPDVRQARLGSTASVGKGRLAAGYDADFTLVDMKRRGGSRNPGSSRPAVGRRSPGWTVIGWPARDDRPRPDGHARRRGLGAPSGKLVKFRG